jgi:hypothetical protein
MGASGPAGRTGLSAPIPQPLRGFRYFRFYPLRGQKTASMLFFASGFASQTQGSVDAGILPARQTPSPFGLGYLSPAAKICRNAPGGKTYGV